MRKAMRLLTICFMVSILLAAAAVWAAADAPEAEAPAAPEEAVTEAEAQPAAPAEDTGTEAEAQDDPLAPVDVPAGGTAGTVYAVGNSGAIAVTVVDYAAGGGDAGVCLDSGDYYYYGAQITGADTGVVIDGAASGYFGSSGGSIPLYDAKGAVSGIVWGACHPTAADCGVGFLLRGDAAGTVLVEDGASFACRDAIVLCSSGSGSFRFHNARLTTEAGVLLQMEPDAGDVSVCYENGSYSGELVNGSDSTLSVTVGHGALLFGDTAQTGGPVEMTVSTGAVWVVDERASLTSLTVEEGGTVYGELLEPDGKTLILFPSDQVLEPGTYTAEPLVEELPMGHGPALPAEEDAASDEDAEIAPDEDTQTVSDEDAQAALDEDADASPDEDTAAVSAPEQDADRANKLFPLAPSPVIPDGDTADEELPVPPEDEADDSEKPAAPKAAEGSQEPAETAAPAPEPTEIPEQDEEPQEDTEDEPALPDVAQTAMRRSLLLGAGVASPSALSAPVGAVTPSLDFAARLAVRTTGQPPAACLLKTGAKTHSFLPQTLDNQAIILYNPYCCSAA